MTELEFVKLTEYPLFELSVGGSFGPASAPRPAVSKHGFVVNPETRKQHAIDCKRDDCVLPDTSICVPSVAARQLLTVTSLLDKAAVPHVATVGTRSNDNQVTRLVRMVEAGLGSCQEPEAAKLGLGGTYFFKNEAGRKVAIMKPCDEEPLAPNNPKGFVGRALGDYGLKPTIRVGEAAVREVAAYLLDHDHYARVPDTCLVEMAHPAFHVAATDTDARQDVCAGQTSAVKCGVPVKMGSLQKFVWHDCDTSEIGTSRFSAKDVHRIGILDIRLFNTDRHAGNVLVRKTTGSSANLTSLARLEEGQMELIPIDHGFCLPEALEPPYFEWLYWPQASIPFDEDELDYIAKLDVRKDIDLLRTALPSLRVASLRTLEVATTLLKKCAAAGLSLYEIGMVVSRPLVGLDEDPSELEKICYHARTLVDAQQALSFTDLSDALNNLSTEDDTVDSYGSSFCNSGEHSEENLLFKLDEHDARESLGLCLAKRISLDTGVAFADHSDSGSSFSLSSSSDSSNAGRYLQGEVPGQAPASYAGGPREVAMKAKSVSIKRNNVHNGKVLHTRRAAQYPPPVRGTAPDAVEPVFDDLDEQEWDLFMDIVCEDIVAALASGRWKTTSSWPQKLVGVSCPRF